MDGLSNTDRLTGALNGDAYARYVKKLDAETESTERPFGVVSVDINFLKRLNDAYGREHGNICLKACFALVNGIFAPYPVFRIQGDEFVVLLENDALEKQNALVKDLREALGRSAGDDALRPWEQVSASVGCAVFEPGRDRGCNDVLRRAEEVMYAERPALRTEGVG
ncbi:MAG: GGDEF domain-containing protein [Oscillospiraceae bacterium]|nr:GGDEF domain-containing protein [Oscillospiraceae bacterium]